MDDNGSNTRFTFLGEMPNAEKDLYLGYIPFQFHNKKRDTSTLTSTAEFVEMLCTIDERLGKVLPPQWMEYPYMFALMDALRCNYICAYAVVRTGQKVKSYPVPNEQQVRFWMNEDRVYGMISAYVHFLGISSTEVTDEIHKDEVPYSTQQRREQESNVGIHATTYYSWINTQATQPTLDVNENDSSPTESKDMPEVNPITGEITSSNQDDSYQSPWL